MAAVTDPALPDPQTGLANTAGASPAAVTPDATATPASASPPPFPNPSPVAPIASYDPAQATAQQALAKGYAATPYVVPEKGLVQNQIKDIVQNDSPLMQQARATALQTMNQRGLANSSLNTQAGQQAVLTTALPIAQADAQSNVAAMTNTANAQNVASQFNTGAENTAQLANSQLVTTLNVTNANARNTQLSQTAQAENARMLSVIDNNTKQALALLDTQNRQLLQTNANAASMFQETVKNIAAVSVDATLSQSAKDAAVATQINLLNQGLATTSHIATTTPAEIQGLNLDKYFQTDASGGAAFTPAQKAQQVQQVSQQLSAAQQHAQQIAQGVGVPLLTGPNASERRKPIWQQMIGEAQAEVTRLQQQLTSLQAPA
jgi:hypothetical protein